MRIAYLYPSLLDNFKFITGILQRKQAFTGPHTVMIDIEDDCDLNCIMCYFHSPLLGKKEEFCQMSYETYRSILEELKTIGTRKISICGKGEPFLHHKIYDILELTKKMKFYVNIFTNGIHIDKEFLKNILGLDQITFSLHAGDRDAYYEVHPQAGEDCFEQIRYILNEIRGYKQKNHRTKPWIKIINVIFNLNFNRISEIFRFAEEFKVDELLFKPVQLTPEQAILGMNSKQIDYLIQSLRKWQSSQIKNNINTYLATIIPNNHNYVPARVEKPFKRTCYIPWYQSTILSNGNVVACPYNQVVLGNVKNENFRDIWYSAQYNRFRKTLDCSNCVAEAVYPYLMRFKSLFPWKKKR